MSGDKNNSLNDIGKQITSSLSEGLKSGDFSGLNKAISDSVESVVNDALGLNYTGSIKTSDYDARTYKEGSRTREYQDRIAKEHERRRAARLKEQQELARARQEKLERQNALEGSTGAVPARYKKVNNALTVPGSFHPIGNVSGNVCAIGGAVGMLFSFAKTIVNGVSALFVAGSGASVATPAALFIIFLGFFSFGMYNRGMLDRARRYAQACGEKMYISISELASGTGMKPKRLIRDIKRMLKKGIFPQGHLDEKETTLMLSNAVYEEYLKTEKHRKLLEDEKNIIDAQPGEYKDLDELSVMMKEGENFIERIHSLNDRIPGEAITAKLSRSETLLKEIFACVREHPDQMGRTHKLMDYYLPTMIKLVEAYAEYDKISAPGEEIIKAKAEIENTLDKINEAFGQLLNNLFRDSVWDVTSDAKVLETMLKQEGLT
ncbi:MAG: 5-bromo-4-chloroindolyl phosphate hydrolysis family protein [Lachnospiraceae bacterium]|nr:5-bromo-4-chloroindolyl phosphate hydrolysis family protein [Lachnospiraceae bacterium]